jgi:hypothetical protein
MGHLHLGKFPVPALPFFDVLADGWLAYCELRSELLCGNPYQSRRPLMARASKTMIARKAQK